MKGGLSEIKDCASRILISVKSMRSSPNKAQAFERCVKEERVACKCTVCLDIATRWNSTYLMLDSEIKFRKVFKRLEDEDPNYNIDFSHDTPLDEDWEKAIVFVKFLRKFYKAKNRMSGSNYVTYNNYFHEIVGIVISLNEWEKYFNPSLHTMSKRMTEKLNKYFRSLDKVNMMVLIAVVLDPRNKMNYVSWCYKRYMLMT
ncbi:hypothetical protein Patl1_14178 [Pistacia atlantica]|uniref:Uncharacterized protein n=1 Tax=Pistacia atlantica TaxID=434234 RepID=A0ACC1AS52_9ROSI|nr:hypothetical protein Patl1_14178 [Pistacia atlantica]